MAKSAIAGPCPPLGGRHRYVFTLIALGVPTLTVASPPDAEAVISAALPYMVGRADLVSGYQR
ncbi:MAG: YbhB/YbcL family Raf kinase inhibitor-like protein [Stellaceae bacterium]